MSYIYTSESSFFDCFRDLFIRLNIGFFSRDTVKSVADEWQETPQYLIDHLSKGGFDTSKGEKTILREEAIDYLIERQIEKYRWLFQKYIYGLLKDEPLERDFLEFSIYFKRRNLEGMTCAATWDQIDTELIRESLMSGIKNYHSFPHYHEPAPCLLCFNPDCFFCFEKPISVLLSNEQLSLDAIDTPELKRSYYKISLETVTNLIKCHEREWLNLVPPILCFMNILYDDRNNDDHNLLFTMMFSKTLMFNQSMANSLLRSVSIANNVNEKYDRENYDQSRHFMSMCA